MDARTFHTMGAAGPESGYAPDPWAMDTARDRLGQGMCPDGVRSYLRGYGLTHSAACAVIGAVQSEIIGAAPGIDAAMIARSLQMES